MTENAPHTPGPWEAVPEPVTNPMPAYLAAKRDALLRGERVGLTDRDLDALEADGIEIRTIPNPARVGIMDRWVGWIDTKAVRIGEMGWSNRQGSNLTGAENVVEWRCKGGIDCRAERSGGVWRLARGPEAVIGARRRNLREIRRLADREGRFQTSGQCHASAHAVGECSIGYVLHIFDADDNCLSSDEECYQTEAEAEQAVRTARSRHPGAARIDIELSRCGDSGRPRYEHVSAWKWSDAEQRFVRIL